MVVRLDRITTRSGDTGETGLGDGSRVAKTHPRIAALGAVDEANAAIGLCRLEAEGDIDALLARLQNQLFDLGADLAIPGDGPGLRVTPAMVAALEAEVAAATARVAPLTSFVLPGGTRLAAQLHGARTVARRAEAACWALAAADATLNPHVAVYLNRLSDLLFVMARLANDEGRADVLWRPGAA